MKLCFSAPRHARPFPGPAPKWDIVNLYSVSYGGLPKFHKPQDPVKHRPEPVKCCCLALVASSTQWLPQKWERGAESPACRGAGEALTQVPPCQIRTACVSYLPPHSNPFWEIACGGSEKLSNLPGTASRAGTTTSLTFHSHTICPVATLQGAHVTP